MSERRGVIADDEIGTSEPGVLNDAESVGAEFTADAKLHAMRAGAQFSFPTSDIDEMNRKIVRGYQG